MVENLKMNQSLHLDVYNSIGEIIYQSKISETKTEIILQNTNNKNANDGNANSMETVALLPTVNTIQDFYFETEENTDLIADNFSQEYATTQTKSTPRAKNSALKTLAPEGSFDKRETKFWDAFVPSTRNNDNDRTTAFLDSFKPAAYSK